MNDYWMNRCTNCLDFEYDDSILGKCIHFEQCKADEDKEDE